MAKIEGVRILTPDGVFRKGDVEFEEKITRVHTYDDDKTDAPYLIPGLVEIHSHGALNCDHSDGDLDGLEKIAAYYAQNGVTSFLATTMTYDEEVILGAMKTIRSYKDTFARCLGINMEGPFLSYEKRGAHMAEKLRKPDVEMFERLNEASGGAVKLVSVAAELEGAMEFIREVSPHCKIAIAHSAADYDTSLAAFENGADHVTHLYNAMNPLGHRAPGLIGAALDAGAYVELICDGMHVHPAVVRATFKMFAEKVCMISDSIRCAGLPDGNYVSGGLPVKMEGGKALLMDGTIAGASVSLMEGVRRAVGFGIPIEAAVQAATKTNAQSIGMQEEVGIIAKGRFADMLILDSKLNIMSVYINGKEYNK